MVNRNKRSPVLLVLTIAALLSFLVITAGKAQSPFPSAHICNENDAAEFLQTLGYECESTYITTQKTTLPQQFDEVFIQYNAIQLQQGCDLTKYAGKEIMVYTAPVINYTQSSDDIYATVLVYKGSVIGGDIHSAVMDGFMLPLKQ